MTTKTKVWIVGEDEYGGDMWPVAVFISKTPRRAHNYAKRVPRRHPGHHVWVYQSGAPFPLNPPLPKKEQST